MLFWQNRCLFHEYFNDISARFRMIETSWEHCYTTKDIQLNWSVAFLFHLLVLSSLSMLSKYKRYNVYTLWFGLFVCVNPYLVDTWSKYVYCYVCTRETVSGILVCTRETVSGILVCTRETVSDILVCTRETVSGILVCTRETVPGILVCTRETVSGVLVCTREQCLVYLYVSANQMADIDNDVKTFTLPMFLYIATYMCTEYFLSV